MKSMSLDEYLYLVKKIFEYLFLKYGFKEVLVEEDGRLDMPQYLYSEIYQKYPGDFHLINQLMLDDFIAEKKPCILETSLDEIKALNYTPEVLWEIEYLREHGYNLVRGGGPNGLDILLPSE